MNVAPGRVPTADLEHHQIKRSQAGTYVLELRGESGVTTEEDTVMIRTDRKRRPQRRVARRTDVGS